eukprot:TRINITY_DN16135_c0_g1_i1.p1 TRINITY_DN16135_c0_g1~~TRINITY_DN16135_c0_g1_i1.p1  ORF type:complete len:417 (-),score=198.79 TRINITY_DN16135_c0_g1_i1:57-1307(-)
MGTLSGANDHDKLADLAGRTYKEQAVWFLNAFWDELGTKEAENLWNNVQGISALDSVKGKEGNSVNEMEAHRFLEKLHETMTVQNMRDKLRSTGALAPNERPKLVPLVHYLIIHYNRDFHILVNATQGSKEEIQAAQNMLDEVNSAFRESEARSQEAAEALRASKAAEAEATRRDTEAKRTAAQAKATEQAAKAAEAEAVQREEAARTSAAEAAQREAELKAAQDELEAALAETKAQEDARNNRTAELTKASETGGQVSRNKAKNELAQHLGQDPLPLRKAKITQEAAVKKADRATQVAAQARAVADEQAGEAGRAREQAENAAQEAERQRVAADQAAEQASRARQAAEAAARESERAAQAAEEAVEEARRKVEEAEAFLEEAKKRLPHGSTWWLERELAEAKKYLPKSRGGVERK